MRLTRFIDVTCVILLLAALVAAAGCSGGGNNGGSEGGGGTGGSSIVVTPAQLNVQGSTTQQFSALVSGEPVTDVAWSVNGVGGGNLTLGLISSTGLYLAPNTAPTSSPVTVTASSQSNSTSTGSASVTITPSGLTPLLAFGITPGTIGANPAGSLTFDSQGNLYGTASQGGNTNCAVYGYSGCGVVFELSPSSNGTWAPTILYSFTGNSDGEDPTGSLVLDGQGNLYGTTVEGGGNSNCANGGCGTVFKLAFNSSSNTWMKSTVHSFTGDGDGVGPLGGLAIDAQGNLYGTTYFGGDVICGCGIVFELTPSSSGLWTESILHTFTGPSDGGNPQGTLIFDSKGNLYGTSSGGQLAPGVAQFGTVFELAPTSGNGWNYTVLYDFAGGSADGATPNGGLAFDQQGNLYGADYSGGTADEGVVFKLTPNGQGAWTESVLYNFQGGSDGAIPDAAPVVDSSGNVYGTTMDGGNSPYCSAGTQVVGCGTIYKLSRQSDGTWPETVLHRFMGGSDGIAPQASLTLDSHDTLYGTAYLGGLCCNAGVVYSFIQSTNNSNAEGNARALAPH
jgi:uncharacterized repeat protein (TIGR03803 family)